MALDTLNENTISRRNQLVQRAGDSPIPTVVLEKTKIIGCNNSFLSSLGFTASSELLHRSVKNILTPPHFRKLSQYINDPPEIPPSGFEAVLVKKDGSKIDGLVFLAKSSDNNDETFQLTFVDITNRNEELTKLSQSENLYKELIEKQPEGICLISEGKITFANSGLAVLFGYDSTKDLCGNDYSSLIDVQDQAHTMEHLLKFQKKKLPSQTAHFTAKRKDGSTFKAGVDWVKTDETTKSTFIAYHRDETESISTKIDFDRKTIETGILNEVISAMDYSRELHSILQSGLSKLLDLVHAESGGVFLINKKNKTFDLEVRRNIPETLLVKLDQQSIEEGIGGYLSKTLEAHVFDVKKYPSFLPHGKLFKELVYASVAFIPLVVKEVCNGFIFLCSKKAGKDNYPSKDFFGILGREIGSAVNNAKSFSDVKNSQLEYKQLIETVTDVLYEAAPNGAFRYISPTIEMLVHYPPKEFYRNPTLWLSMVHPDDKKLLLDRNANIDSIEERFVFEYRVLPKGKASYRWVRDVNAITRDENNNVAGIKGIISEITNYKQLTDELIQSNELNSSILSSIREGVVVYNKSLQCIQWNNSMEEITGLKREEVIGRVASEIFSDELPENPGRLIQNSLNGEVVTSEEIPYRIKKSNKDITVWGRYSPLRDSHGNIVGVVGIVTDISERKTFERELKESEQILRNIIDTIGDILMITDLKGNIFQVNRAFLNHLGYTRKQVIGREFPYPWLIEEEMGRYVLWIATLRENSMLHDFDMTWKAKDGRLISMSLSTTLLRNSLGDPIAMVNIARDISERKRLTKDLEDRNRQVELLNRIISAANQSMEFDEILKKIHTEINAVIPCDALTITTLQPDGKSLNLLAGVGISADRMSSIEQGVELVSLDAVKFRKPVIVGNISKSKYQDKFHAKSGLESIISLPMYLKDRILGTFSIAHREPDVFTENHLTILESIVPQIGAIMDRISLFKQVSEDASYIHNLLDSIDSVVYTIDTQFRILEVNKAWYEFIRESGVEPLQDYAGIPIFTALPDESLKTLFQNVAVDVLSGSVRFFSQEFSQKIKSGTRIYQLTMNPTVIDRKITGLVISHSDITALKESELALKASNEQLITLNEIAALQGTAHGLEDILSTTIPLLKKMIEADAAVVYLVPRGETNLKLVHQVGFKEDLRPMLPYLIARGSPLGIAVGTREALYISQVGVEHNELIHSSKDFLLKEGIRSLAIIPLTSKDEVFGALDIFYLSRHNFPEQEREVLTLIGNQLGSAIENAQLYGELRAQIERLTVLYEFSEQLTSKLDVHQIYQVAYEHIARVIPFKTFSITLVSSMAGEIISSFVVAAQDDSFVVQSDIKQVLRLRKETPEWKVIETRHSYHNETYTRLYVPMFSKNNIIGVMNVNAEESERYSELHIRLLENIANLTAIALEKGTLYEETIQKSSEIERRNRELDDFTYVVSHDLKEPLISIEGFSKILQIDYHDKLEEEGKEYLDSITGATIRMKALIDDLLMLSRVSRPAESFKQVDVNKVLLDIQNDMEFTIRQRDVDFVIPEALPSVQGHETQVKIVFRNLIGNALKFNKSPKPTIEIGFQNAENNYYLFSVRDNGIGIEKEFFEKIFVIFQRLHRREDYDGTGAGLAIVKKIIEIHNGKIWVESEPAKGSTFYFTLPSYVLNE
ncbi:MAG: PAS domain S-box protein [Bacteroidota bacterium]